MHDVIIIGSGAAGTAAAVGLVKNGIKPLILDVGIATNSQISPISENLYDYKSQNDSFELTIGRNLRGLNNLLNPEQAIPVKLTAPGMEFVTRDAEKMSPVQASNFTAIQSFASGGLANAWGAGLYRFNTEDLQGVPLTERELIPYFEQLTCEIGIAGTDDCLTPFFGDSSGLLEPLRLSRNATHLYSQYCKYKDKLNRAGVYVGRPRVAVLSEAKDGRSVCEYNNLEFWQPGMSHIYTPQLTIEKLIEKEKIFYEGDRLVVSWKQETGFVRVWATSVANNQSFQYLGKKLIMAAGTINSAKLALISRQDYETKLQLFDNPAIQMPLVFPLSIGQPIEKNAFGLVQLNLIWENNPFGERLQGSILEITSPLRAEFFGSLPYCASANLPLLRYLLPAMMVMQLYFPTSSQKPSFLKLCNGNSLRIIGEENTIDTQKVRRLLRYLRWMGVFSHPALFINVPTGQAIHYAGTLPMRHRPTTPYECFPSGRLNFTNDVYIADGAVFPELPAKNSSFTMMANAMRIADLVSNELRSLS
ncbi:hypothetical protein KFU94_06490 [Chloroflexi bacterium TSY]|nr:hypothetical protein [Chloroflexi bacterium TSY]